MVKLTSHLKIVFNSGVKYSRYDMMYLGAVIPNVHTVTCPQVLELKYLFTDVGAGVNMCERGTIVHTCTPAPHL